MQSIFVCNTAGDSLSEISLMNYSVNNYSLDLEERPVGPNNVICSNGNLIISNSYNNSISVFSLKDKKEMRKFYVGAHPTDLKEYESSIYVVCSDANSVIELDVNTGDLITAIPVGEYPHNIEIDYESKTAYVTSLKGNIISVIDLEKKIVTKSIKTHENPTKCFLSKDKKILYLCESNLGKDMEGYISFISTNNYKVVKRIRVGMEPRDFLTEGNKMYVTNSGEGSLSILDMTKGHEVKKIYLGGMTSSILKSGNDIFISDFMNNRVIKVNLKERIIKNIAVGKEPNAMILVDYLL